MTRPTCIKNNDGAQSELEVHFLFQSNQTFFEPTQGWCYKIPQRGNEEISGGAYEEQVASNRLHTLKQHDS